MGRGPRPGQFKNGAPRAPVESINGKSPDRAIVTGQELSGRAIETNRMVSDVLVKVGQSEKQLEHTIPLFRIRVARALLETFHDREGIGEEPFETLWIAGHAAMAFVESLIGAKERFIEKMIETKLFGCKSRRNRFRTRGPRANCGCAGAHDTPHPLGGNVRSEICARLTHF
jgi:hypothetical protein